MQPNLEQICVSLETAKDLQKAGWKQSFIGVFSPGTFHTVLQKHSICKACYQNTGDVSYIYKTYLCKSCLLNFEDQLTSLDRIRIKYTINKPSILKRIINLLFY